MHRRVKGSLYSGGNPFWTRHAARATSLLASTTADAKAFPVKERCIIFLTSSSVKDLSYAVDIHAVHIVAPCAAKPASCKDVKTARLFT